MNWFTKLPGSRKEAPGLEWRVLRCLPVLALAGSVLPMLYALGVRFFDGGLPDADTLKAVQSADILAIAAVILHWTVILTLALGCAIVVVMKGHAYVADAYPLVEKDFPPD